MKGFLHMLFNFLSKKLFKKKRRRIQTSPHQSELIARIKTKDDQDCLLLFEISADVYPDGEDVFYNDFEKYSVTELMHWFRSDSIKDSNYKAGYAASDVANYAKHCCSNYTLKELDENKFVRFDVSDRIKTYISESVKPKNARYEIFMVLCSVIDDPRMKEELQPLVANKEVCL